MARLFSLLIPVMILCMPSAARAKDIPANSIIKAVTVYTDRATVTRVAAVDVPAGAQTVVFRDLPALLLPDSLRATGSAQADVTIGAVASRRVITRDLTSERERALNDQLETLQNRIRMIDAEKQALAAQRAFLDGIGKQAVSRTNEALAEMTLNPDQWAAAAGTIQSQMAEIFKADVIYDLKKQETGVEIRKVQEELNQLRTGQRASYEVTIPLEASAATRLTLSLDYQVPNAGWRPLYDARLETESGALDMLQYGAVYQRTGEDWNDVALRLSTARPQRGASLPNLPPWWVDLWDNSRRQKSNLSSVSSFSSDTWGGQGDSLQENMLDAAPAFEEAAKTADFAVASVETGGFVTEYNIPGPANVPADGTETKLMVGTFETDTALKVYVRPQLSTDAFLVADTILKGEAPLLPGQVSLFRDGSFVGNSQISLMRPGENFALFFGVDDQLSVTRKVLTDSRKDAGVIARNNTLERRYVTSLQNLHKMPVSLVVEETVPAPQNEKITRDIVKDETTPGYTENYEDTKGLLRWDIDLPPGATKKVELGWKLSWPKDQNLSSL
ncbi:MAG: mucoidy inhibitor MuiA family protein [Alphaproteobacteria bacterium]|nr:mucoidy inhibitor MuiA family protein [Alphaproteobacteria bacterium]